MNSSNPIAWMFAASAIALGWASAANAQDVAAGAEAAPVEDRSAIVVTARRTEERLQDVPISITVYNQEQLESRNVISASDLAAYTPSLSSNANYGSQQTSFAIRGFAQDAGTAPSVGVYFADVVAPRGASGNLPAGDGLAPGQLFDLANVQVLKGPQGTLFGRNTTGGAVLIVPQRPTGDFEGFVEGSIGNFDMRRVQAVVNIPVTDTMRLRLGVDRQRRDGYLRNTGGIGPADFNDLDYLAIRASMIAELTPDLENYTVVSYNLSKTNGTLNKLVAAGPEGLGGLALAQLARQGNGFYDVAQTLSNPFSRQSQWQVVNTTSWTVSDTLTIKNIASYAELQNRQNSPLFGTDLQVDLRAIGSQLFRIPFATITSIPTGNTASQSTITEELQLQGRAMGDRLSWQAGAYLEISNPLGDSGAQSPFLAACTDSTTLQCRDPLGLGTYLASVAAGGNPAIFPHAGAINYSAGRTWFRNVGVYAQGTYKLSDQFKVTGGMRYTWDRQRIRTTQRTYIPGYPESAIPGLGFTTGNLFPAFLMPETTPPFTNPRCTNPLAVATNCTSTYRQKSSKPTWLIDLDYTPTDDLLIYAKYARGYRAGTIAPEITAPLNIIEPEKVDSYEIGLKASFRGPIRGTLNAAAFYNDFSNQQLQLGFNGKNGQASTAAPVNAGKSEIWGFEVDGTLVPFEGMVLGGGYTYLRTRIKEVRDFSTFNDPNYELNAPFLEGDPEVLSPRHKVTVSATYTLPLDESIGRISFGASYTHRARMLVNYSDRVNPNPAIAALSWLPSLDLVSLNASWTDIGGAPVDVSAFMTNVTGERYYLFAPGVGGTTAVNFETAVVGEPRMYGLRLKFRFGR